MKKTFALLMVFLAVLSMACIKFPMALAESPSSGWLFFYDDFEGVAVNSSKWNTNIATSGVRWHSSTDDPTLAHTLPGNWEIPPVSPPYGSITVADSITSFKDVDTPSQVFPYIWAGPPSRPSPFPATGDFILEVRMKYDRISPHGCGLRVLGWPDSDPIGDNPPTPAGEFVIHVWPEIPNDLNWHTYKLTYESGQYCFFVDNSLVYGPVTSTLRPNTIWIGNPLFVHWGAYDWSRFSIDYVRVTATGWPMFRHNPARTGTTPQDVAPPLRLLWAYETGGEVHSSPAVVGNVVYIGSHDWSVYALNAYTGAKIWSHTTGSAVSSSPAVFGGIVYVGSWDTYVYALNATTGAEVWKYKTESIVGSSPVVSNGVLYIGSGDTNVYALNASTGAKIWNYKTGGAVASSPAVSDDVVYVGSDDGNVYAIDATTGTKIWSFTVEESYIPVRSSPTVADGTLYVNHHPVYALNATTGEKKWEQWSVGDDSSPAISGAVLYFGIFALSTYDGSVIWWVGYVFSSPAVSDGYVYVGSEGGPLCALDAYTGEVKWSYATGGYIKSSPAISNGIVYVGSLDKKVYAFTADDTPPTIGSPSREPSGDVTPDQEVTVSVNVTDAESGVKNVTLSYTTDNGTSWINKPMTYNSTTGLYQATILGEPYCIWVKYKIIAYDIVGNHATNDNAGEYFVYHVIPEFPPAIILSLLMTLSILAAILAKRRITGKQKK